MSTKHRRTFEAKPDNLVANTPDVDIGDKYEPVPEEEIPKPTIGFVDGCAKLNVRMKPSLEAGIVCEIASDTRVLIDTAVIDNDWYSICLENGIEGYCMKKFIKIVE